MASSDPPDWAEIRHLYLEGERTVAKIAERYGVSIQRIYQRARREEWPRRTASAVIAKASANRKVPSSRKTAPPSQSKRQLKHIARTAPNSLKARRALVRRLYKAIDTKLQQMERRMARDMATDERTSETTAADHERDTRAIGALIANLSRVTEIEADLERIPGTATDQQADRQLADEAERFRRDVAERLARLVRPA
jgi:type IV secretory pathway VirB10-like protein